MENEYDGHFILSGYYRITAKSEEEAREKVNDIINARIEKVEETLQASLADEEYTTDVIQVNDTPLVLDENPF